MYVRISLDDLYRNATIKYFPRGIYSQIIISHLDLNRKIQKIGLRERRESESNKYPPQFVATRKSDHIKHQNLFNTLLLLSRLDYAIKKQ